MQPFASNSRRQFLRQTLAFSAASLTGALTSCGKGIIGTTSDVAHLLMLGDWGAIDQHLDQNTVAAAMQTYARTHGLNTQALLMLGDNFYGELGSTSSSRWKDQFEDMYPRSIFNCPAYAIPGNHDYIQDNGILRYDIELQYGKAAQTRWTMPAQYYRFLFPTLDPLVTFIALDSNIPYADGATQRGGFFTMSAVQQAAQLQWLSDELKKPLSTPFLIIMAHHPLYSDGPHGDNQGLIDDWDPLLRQHHAHVYLAGHDHDLQHLEFEGHPTSFFCSGGGGADLYNLRIPPDKRGPYAAKAFGFGHLEVTKSLLTLRHVDQNGNVIHAFTKTPNNELKLIA
jgi:hypothetical protein